MSSLHPQWYAVYTRSRHEKQVAAFLQRQSIETYVPVRRAWSSRKDRKSTVDLPAMPGYVFVRCVLYPETRAMIKRPTGVLRLVENVGRPAVIPKKQIDSLRKALEATFNAEGHPFLSVGDRVRVTKGPMLGAEGYLVRANEEQHRLVISVEHVNQALSVEIDADCVEPVSD
jgi:transcriptional antiterminator NusG